MILPESNLSVSDLYHIVTFDKDTFTDTEDTFHTYKGLFYHKQHHFFVKMLLKDHRSTRLTLVFYYDHEHDLITLKEASDSMQRQLKITASNVKSKKLRWHHQTLLYGKLKKNPVPAEEIRKHSIRGIL